MMRFLSSILLKHCKHAMRNLDQLKYDMKILLGDKANIHVTNSFQKFSISIVTKQIFPENNCNRLDLYVKKYY